MSEQVTLRKANIHRQAEWDRNSQITLTYRANEMGGEVGEALEHAVGLIMLSIAAGRASNIAKKLVSLARVQPPNSSPRNWRIW